MKIVLLTSILFIGLTHPAAANEAASRHVLALKDLKTTPIKSIWFVPQGSAQVHFIDPATAAVSKNYVIPGDLLIGSEETADRVCASYIIKKKVTAGGWVDKGAVKKFDLLSFGVDQPDWPAPDFAALNKSLEGLSAMLPPVTNWKGEWWNADVSSVEIWKKGNAWELDDAFINGVVSDGNKDNESEVLSTKGALAIIRRESGYDVCDIVIAGFNNAILATSGERCLGSGYPFGSWPEFSGVYWKQ